MTANKLGTSGGKGNLGMFIERDSKLCAAGVPTAQGNKTVAEAFDQYLLKDEVDALLSDTIFPPEKPRKLPPLRKPPPLDRRFAGPFVEVAELVNPQPKTKFQTLVEDFKNTSYASYWKKPLGQVRDPVPMLPEGFDTFGTTFGRKCESHDRLYDIVMPKSTVIDKTPPEKNPGVQLDRKYCEPSYNKDFTYGYRTFIDKRGILAKFCLTDDRIVLGTGERTILNTVQTNHQEKNQPRVGMVLAPNNNINQVPAGHSFGKIKPPDSLIQCLTFCELNPQRILIKQCMAHLNTLRKTLSTRLLPTFFHNFYLNLKYYDCNKSGWLPEREVYEICTKKHIRFDPSLLYPLLKIWQAYDGSNIEYNIFTRVINYREPVPEMPKIPDLPPECLDFNTTYSDMIKSNQEGEHTKFMAGVSSGRYFDKDYPVTPENCCRADRTCLPHESDMKACLNPSILTRLHVNHRDMYAKREPEVVKRVFEAIGEKFTDETFNNIWEEAKKFHSQGWVCFETFRKALNDYTNRIKNEKANNEK